VGHSSRCQPREGPARSIPDAPKRGGIAMAKEEGKKDIKKGEKEK
jgi:hypothetical protein